MSRIGIAGFGFVGQALYMSAIDNGNIVIYDKYKNMGNILDLKTVDFIFTCLPTKQKTDGTQDFSEYKLFFEEIKGYEGIIVVKSTVLYNNIEPYLNDFNIVLNPEFLNQNSSVEDFRNQKLIVLGGRADLLRRVMGCYNIHFILINKPEYNMCTIEEAIYIKYIHNIYHAYKSLFWNYVQSTTGNARKMFNLYTKISERNEMASICSDGRPGYGGACFPKDVAAIHSVNNHPLTEYMIHYNAELRNGGNPVFD